MMNGEEGARRGGRRPTGTSDISYISTVSFERQSTVGNSYIVRTVSIECSIHRMLLLLLFRALWVAAEERA